MMMTSEQIDGILEAKPIHEVVKEHVLLTPVGDKFQGTCPFCLDRDAFHVSPRHKIFHCFRCHRGGNSIRFIQLIKDVTFEEAVKLLS